MEMYTHAVLGGLVSSASSLVGWIVAVVLATIMLRRGGSRAERFLLIGASLMLVQSIIAIPTAAIGTWLMIDKGMSSVKAASVLSIYGLIRGCIGLGGIICLVYAYWEKFKKRTDSILSI
jgi:hypothetical protein